MALMAHEEMSRGQWQAGMGSEIFGGYYKMLTEANPARAMEIWTTAEPEQALVHMGFKSAQHLHSYPGSKAADTWLLSYQYDLLKYTDIASFPMRDPSTLLHSMRVFIGDGLEFAHATTMGAVVETLWASELDLDREETYRGAHAVLKNPQFEHVLGTLATTGFAVLGTTAQPTSHSLETASLHNVKTRVLAEDIGSAIVLSDEVDTVDDLRTVGMELHPELKKTLRRELAQQNYEMKTGTAPEFNRLMWQHVGRPGFSSGCPVVHNGMTFGLMRSYLARTVRLTAEAEKALAA